MGPPWLNFPHLEQGQLLLLGSDTALCHTERVYPLPICLYPQAGSRIPGAMSDSLLFFKKRICAGPASAFSIIGEDWGLFLSALLTKGLN